MCILPPRLSMGSCEHLRLSSDPYAPMLCLCTSSIGVASSSAWKLLILNSSYIT